MNENSIYKYIKSFYLDRSNYNVKEFIKINLVFLRLISFLQSVSPI